MNVYRFDEEAGVIRSAGDPPGVLVLAFPDGRATFAVDPSWMPGKGRTRLELPSGSGYDLDQHEGGIASDATPVAVDEVLDGITDAGTLSKVWETLAEAVPVLAPLFLREGAFDEFRSLIDLAEELRAGVEIVAAIIEERGRDERPE